MNYTAGVTTIRSTPAPVSSRDAHAAPRPRYVVTAMFQYVPTKSVLISTRIRTCCRYWFENIFTGFIYLTLLVCVGDESCN